MGEGVKAVPAESPPEQPPEAAPPKAAPTAHERTMDYLALAMRSMQKHWPRLDRWEKLNYDEILIFMKEMKVDIRKLPNPVIPRSRPVAAAAPTTAPRT